MQLLDDYLFNLWRKEQVTKEDVLAKCNSPDELAQADRQRRARHVRRSTGRRTRTRRRSGEAAIAATSTSQDETAIDELTADT